MYRCAKLDMYNYSFTYIKDKINSIQLYFDPDDLSELASVSTDITSHDNLIYVEGKRFIQKGQNIKKTNTGYILEILVK